MDHHILHKAQCFQGNLREIAKSIPLVSVGPCLLRQGKNNKYYQFTNTGLLHSSDLQRPFDLSKQTKTWPGNREALPSHMHVPLGDSKCSSVMWTLGRAWSLSTRKKMQNWYPSCSDGETICAWNVSDEAHFFKDSFNKIASNLHFQEINYYLLSLGYKGTLCSKE